jgi:pantoate--beta-alanine ligase
VNTLTHAGIRPVVARSRDDLVAALAQTRSNGGRVLFVPTMGALHEGHASLMRHAARARGPHDMVAVSIFVNPLQFAPGEDLDAYPRTLDADLDLCAREGVGVVFAPTVKDVYPTGEPSITVEPGPLATILEGNTRPTHFRGVLTVVAKLFGLVRPDVAFFGEKDFQQLALIRAMAADLCMGVDVFGVATVREVDGLALSSRNRYLDSDQRATAVGLSRALRAGVEAASGGARAALAAAHDVLAEYAGIDLDYLELTAPDLGPAPESGEGRLLIAARVGTTRLIDNVAVTLGPAAEENS